MTSPTPNPGGDQLPPVLRAAWVQLSPQDAFRVFTEEIGAWWPLPTHGLFGDRASSVEFRDGEVIEIAVDGSHTVWAEVVQWDPGVGLSLNWHPGATPAEGTAVDVSFSGDEAGTRVTITHHGWETFGEQAMERRNGYLGPSAWGYVLDHFGDCAEPSPNAVDLSALRAAYETFFVEAEQGGFGPAPEGEWNADQVVAHVALNDLSMALVCQALVHRNPPRFENQTCQDRAVLASYIESAGDLAGLIERGRQVSAQFSAALSRLAPDQLETLVECHLTHDGEVVVDQPMPWQSVAIDIQSARHLPAHVEQLQNLRTS